MIAQINAVRPLSQSPGTCADEADQAGRIPESHAVVGNVPDYDGSRSDQRPPAYCYAGYSDGPSTEARTLSDASRAELPIVMLLQSPVGIDGSGKSIVRETGMRPHENAIIDGDAFENRRPIFDLDPIPDNHPFAYVDTLAEDAFLANHCIFPDLGQMPDPRSEPNPGGRCDGCGRMYEWLFQSAPQTAKLAMDFINRHLDSIAQQAGAE